MKICSVCGAEKPLSDYYLRKDGRPCTSRCKDCHKRLVKENRQNKADQYRAYEKERAQLPHRVKARKEYAQGKGKEIANAAKKRWQERNPKKRSVHVLTGNAIRDGLIQKSCCEVCGTWDVVAHHKDYDKPLEITWLCPKHHEAWHKENGEGLNSI